MKKKCNDCNSKDKQLNHLRETLKEERDRTTKLYRKIDSLKKEYKRFIDLYFDDL